MITYAECDIITRMDISVLATTNDIEQLCTLALAVVQSAVSENAEKEEKLLRQNTTLEQPILLLEEALKLARRQRFGKKGETLVGQKWRSVRSPGCTSWKRRTDTDQLKRSVSGGIVIRCQYEFAGCIKCLSDIDYCSMILSIVQPDESANSNYRLPVALSQHQLQAMLFTLANVLVLR